MKKQLKKAEKLTIQIGAMVVLFSGLRDIPYPIRRNLGSRLKKAHVMAASLRDLLLEK